MFFSVFLTVFLLFIATSCQRKFENDWNQKVNFVCPENQVIRKVYSEHNNGQEDRRWKFECAYVPAGVDLSDCVQSGYVNEMRSVSNYQCHDGGFMTGWESYHENKPVEDRRTKYRCCKAKGFLTHSCKYTGYLNDYDRLLNYRIPDDWVLAGVFSTFDESSRDRRFNFNICKLDLQN